MKQTVEEVANEIGGVHPDWDKITCFRIGFKEGARWQSKQSPWISVEERLPEENQKVFVLTMCCGVSRILIERFYKINAFDKDNRWIFGNSIVLAWFPIPSFDEILEANRDTLERIKQKVD